MRELYLDGLATQLIFMLDGRHLITANGNGTHYVLRLAPSAAPSKTK